MCLCCCWLLIIKSAATRCFVFHYDFLLDTWYVMAWRIDPLPPTLTNKRQARSRCQTISMNPLTSVYSESSTASEAPSEQVLSVRIGDDGHTSVGRPHGSLLFPHWRCTFLQMSLHWCPPASQVLLFSQLHLFPPAVARLPLLVAMICDNGLEVGQISQSKGMPVGAFSQQLALITHVHLLYTILSGDCCCFLRPLRRSATRARMRCVCAHMWAYVPELRFEMLHWTRSSPWHCCETLDLNSL